MSFFEININQDTAVFFWNITENLSQLKKEYKKTLPEDYYVFKTETHKKQFIAKQIILKKLSLEKHFYKVESGKPLLKNNKYISVSHSKNIVVVALSNKPVGVDVEKKINKLETVMEKFISPDEYHLSGNMSKNELIYYWTAKEAIYKLLNEQGLKFNNDIKMLSFDKKQSKAIFLVRSNIIINIQYFMPENNFIMAIAQC